MTHLFFVCFVCFFFTFFCYCWFCFVCFFNLFLVEHQKKKNSIAYWSYHWMTKYKPGGSYEVIKPITICLLVCWFVLFFFLCVCVFVYFFLKSNVINSKKKSVWHLTGGGDGGGGGRREDRPTTCGTQLANLRVGFIWLFLLLFDFFLFSFVWVILSLFFSVFSRWLLFLFCHRPGGIKQFKCWFKKFQGEGEKKNKEIKRVIIKMVG